MENKNGSGAGALEKFFAGKGFYIALALCAVVIGVSVWSLSGGEAVEEDVLDVYQPAASSKPLPTLEPGFSPEPEDAISAVPPESVSETPKVQPTPAQTAAETPAPAVTQAPAVTAPESWLWPVSGPVERGHSLDALAYDTTMGDWRTHDGVDITAQIGTQVLAAAAGTVTDIRADALYGTTVVISHAGGWESVYANLAALPAVEIGDTVSAGDVIGAVGDTAICEAAQPTHLHFELSCSGESVDPSEYLA